MRPIEDASFWLARRQYTANPALAGDQRADIVIIGGGFTGLWTAIRLQQLAPTASVVLLEQAILGYGGTGRNAGQVAGTLDHTHQKAIAHFGLAEARRMAAVGLENLGEFEQFLRDQQIDCDYARTGQLLVALNEAQIEDARRTLAAAAEVGVTGFRFLTGAETRAELHSPLYQAGIQDPTWGIIHPIKLVDGLKRVATRLGVQIYEHTRVTGLAAPRVQTPRGTITAGKVVLATNAYSYRLVPNLLRRYLPLYDYVIVSDPLTPEQRAAIGWQNRQAVVDERTFFNYYRLTPDHRILWGTSEARYHPGQLVADACDHSEAHYRQLAESFRRHFPQLPDLKFPYAWGGPIASTTRLTPFFGKLAGGWLVYGLGYTGLGIAHAHLAGKILAHLTLERPSPLLDLELVRHQPLPYPPEPVRTWAVNLITRSLRRVDAGERPGWGLRMLDALGIGFSS